MIIIIKGKKQSTSNKWHYDKTFAFMQPCNSPDLVFQVVVLLSLSGTDFTNDSSGPSASQSRVGKSSTFLIFS